MPKDKLWEDISKMAADLGFAGCGCTPVVPLAGSREESRYLEAERLGQFGKMEYLKRNLDKRMDPALLVPGARSVVVFLAPFGKAAPDNSRKLKVSEFALGEDYHRVIKDKLLRIASFIEENTAGQQPKPQDSRRETAASGKKKLAYSRVFTDSAPVLERAWAVRAGLGFIGKNNFLISPTAGIKNFIGTIITAAELPYTDKTVPNGCGQCTRCLDACSRKALYAPYRIDASKCLSYSTIEEPLDITDKNADKTDEKWIFGCDDCMNACPWNRFNKEGWPEFSSNKTFLDGCGKDFWEGLAEEDFERLFRHTPLMRAGLEKIKNNILR